jgi:hypothetical protein
MNKGWCGDVIATYRAVDGSQTKCGDSSATCCGGDSACNGGDNAWHFFDGTDTHYVGPELGDPESVDCSFWDGIDDSDYTRITACKLY